MQRLWLVAAVVFVAAALLSADEDAKPNFSGKWVLDVAKSDFGPFPPQQGQMRVIDHREPRMKSTVTAKTQQGERTVERTVTTDGKDNVNMWGQIQFKSRSKWDGKRLLTEGTLETPNGSTEVKEAQELSEDGKVLTIKSNYKTPQGEASQKLIFNQAVTSDK